MSFNPTTYEPITTTSRWSAFAKDDSRHQNTAASSQNLINFSDEVGESADAAEASDDDELIFDFEDDMETGYLKKHPKSAPSPYEALYDFEEMPYIHHFVNKDGATKSDDSLAGSQGKPKGKATHTQKDAMNAGDEGVARLAMAINPEKGAAAVDCSEKAHKEPSLNAQLPEQIYFGPNYSGSIPSFYGQSYMPTPNQEFRTVTISRLTANITLLDVLNKIRGGAVVESQLLNTVAITGFKTARIVFLEEFSALQFEDNALVHANMFWGMNVSVELVSAATRPTQYNHGHSRCIEVHNFPPAVRPAGLLAALGHEFRHPIYWEKLNNGNIILHFSSMEKAAYASGLLPRTYRGCRPQYIADPCAEPLEGEALLPPVAL